ncbi:MAG: hypothetical protein ACREIH_01450, partial [Nitrospiraceae bacterium]
MRQGAVECETNDQQAIQGLPVVRRPFNARRVYTALVFAPLFYLLVRYLPAAAFFALVVSAAWLALAEFYRLHFREER